MSITIGAAPDRVVGHSSDSAFGGGGFPSTFDILSHVSVPIILMGNPSPALGFIGYDCHSLYVATPIVMPIYAATFYP